MLSYIFLKSYYIIADEIATRPDEITSGQAAAQLLLALPKPGHGRRSQPMGEMKMAPPKQWGNPMSKAWNRMNMNEP